MTILPLPRMYSRSLSSAAASVASLEAASLEAASLDAAALEAAALEAAGAAPQAAMLMAIPSARTVQSSFFMLVSPLNSIRFSRLNQNRLL